MKTSRNFVPLVPGKECAIARKMSQKTAREINSPAKWLVTANQSPRAWRRVIPLTGAQTPPQLCSLMSQLYPIGKLSGQDLFAGIEIPSKMHSREFDPILFCCIGHGEFEGKCVCAKIPGYRSLVGS